MKVWNEHLEAEEEHRAAAHVMALQVIDDGPGSPERTLAAREPFVTTKSSKAGLGLVTAEALVTASGGIMKYGNRPEGGAKVAVELATPFAPEDDRARVTAQAHLALRCPARAGKRSA